MTAIHHQAHFKGSFQASGWLLSLQEQSQLPQLNGAAADIVTEGRICTLVL